MRLPNVAPAACNRRMNEIFFQIFQKIVKKRVSSHTKPATLIGAAQLSLGVCYSLKGWLVTCAPFGPSLTPRQQKRPRAIEILCKQVFDADDINRLERRRWKMNRTWRLIPITLIMADSIKRKPAPIHRAQVPQVDGSDSNKLPIHHA